MQHRVTDDDTAIAVGSGDVPVLATPRLIAWMEAATVAAAEEYLQPGQTSVGTTIGIEHDRATPVGGVIDVVAETEEGPVERVITFVVEASDGTGEVVASGEIERTVVDREHFLRSVRSPKA